VQVEAVLERVAEVALAPGRQDLLVHQCAVFARDREPDLTDAKERDPPAPVQRQRRSVGQRRDEARGMHAALLVVRVLVARVVRAEDEL